MTYLSEFEGRLAAFHSTHLWMGEHFDRFRFLEGCIRCWMHVGVIGQLGQGNYPML